MKRKYRNKDWLYQKYINEKKSTYSLAKECECVPTTIWIWLKRFGIPRRTLSKTASYRTGQKNPHWKGGIIKHRGRFYVRMPNHPYADRGYISKARAIMEKSLGRLLKSREVIHHINGKKDDDRLENLMLFQTTADHTKFHLNNRR